MQSGSSWDSSDRWDYGRDAAIAALAGTLCWPHLSPAHGLDPASHILIHIQYIYIMAVSHSWRWRITSSAVNTPVISSMLLKLCGYDVDLMNSATLRRHLRDKWWTLQDKSMTSCILFFFHINTTALGVLVLSHRTTCQCSHPQRHAGNSCFMLGGCWTLQWKSKIIIIIINATDYWLQGFKKLPAAQSEIGEDP